ncbi:CotH protein [Fibrobacter sp. UWH5]|uniref:CotH kinase family protein n=1 Tax=Fibrobacter sp. UWH5 TaxID=1896211 RepID=UPI00091009CD|nr:CotH kinase family protein [Fibrobacter sp. UWH5]SHL04416.1 CotH protein [Fibrobacter sp. UWH5]
MKLFFLLTVLPLLILNGCSDFSSESNEFELSGKYYACDGDRYGEIIDDSKLGKKQYCNGYRWIDLVPEDSVIKKDPELGDSVLAMYECDNGPIVKHKDLCSKNPQDYLPLDDSGYPYAGIPRIVIETENFRAIKDRETEIPAKLQIWGENAPESEIMELTIKGRGNSTWKKKKKPYTISFNEALNFLGMKKAKKWVLLANYFDRTLIRNAIAFEIGKKTQLPWTPSGKFVDVYLNRVYQGNYYVAEKVQINKNRLEIGKDNFLLEFDVNYDEKYKFKSNYYDLPINIKNPDTLSSNQLAAIQEKINTIEKKLQEKPNSKDIVSLIDLQSFADYMIVYELTQNSEPNHPKSVYTYYSDKKIHAGPIWDFDWGTFKVSKTGWRNNSAIWNEQLLKNEQFVEIVKQSWKSYKKSFEDVEKTIDSLSVYLHQSGNQNNEKWSIDLSSSFFPDKNKSFDEAISMLKEVYLSRIQELDSLVDKL